MCGYVLAIYVPCTLLLLNLLNSQKKETGPVMVAAGPLGYQKWFPAVKFGPPFGN